MPQPPNTLPSFETPRLLLRPRGPDDLEACLRIDNQPEVVKYIDVPWTDEKSHRAFVEKRLATVYPEGMGYWAIFAKENPEAFLGWVLLMPLDTLGPEIEIGWRLGRAAWGFGYAPEAAAPILEHGMGTLAQDRIMAIIQPENTRSVRVAEKIGLHADGMIEYNGLPVLKYEQTQNTFNHRHPGRDPGSIR